MKKTTIFLFFFLFFFQNINAQHEASDWYFGNDLELNFIYPSIPPFPNIYCPFFLKNYEKNPANYTFFDESQMIQTLISDGNTIITNFDFMNPFYTDLEGSSPTQAVIILPVETSNTDTLFYFFTAPDCEDDNDLKYISIFKEEAYPSYDISDPYTLLHENISHKLATIKNNNENGYWIISHEQNSNNFISYLVDENGINPTPVISDTEPFYGEGFYGDNNRGFLKISASPVGSDSPNLHYLASSSQDNNKVYIYIFNKESGEITPHSSYFFHQPYGIEFSPYKNKLYVNSIDEYYIYQIDIETGEKELIADTENHQPGTMQLGPGGKIYHSTINGDYIHVIHNPSMDAQNCFYDSNFDYLLLPTDDCSQNGTLPSFCASFLKNLDFTWWTETEPQNNLTYFEISDADNIQSANWYFEKDMLTYYETGTSPTVYFDEFGVYDAFVEVIYNDGTQKSAHRLVTIRNSEIDLGNDTTICDTIQYFTLSSNVDPIDVSEIIWYRNLDELDTDDIQTDIDINKPGEYSIEVWFNGIDQPTFDYITVTLSECQNFSFDILVDGEITTGSTTTQCQDNLTVPLSVSPHFDNNNVCYEQNIANSTYTWYFDDGTIERIEGNTNLDYTFENAGEHKIIVIIEDQKACVQRQQTIINLTTNPVKSIREDIISNINEETKLKVGYEDSSSIQLAQTEFINNSFWNTNYEDPIEINNGEISLPINVYSHSNDAVIESINDIQYVYLNMEHSWYEDLTIELECPNGSIAHLIYIADPDYTRIIMGKPIISDPFPNLIGKTELFFWNNNANSTIDDIAGNYTKNYMDKLGNEFNEVKYIPTGAYKPYLLFTNLIGCPINGEWKINISDDDPADNGYISSFGILFDSYLFQSNLTINSIEWSGDYITQTIDSVIYIVPKIEGDILYNCTITDEKSCTYDNEVIVHVGGDITNLVIPNAFTPNGDGVNDTWQFGNAQNITYIKVQIFNQTGKIVSEYILDENNSLGWDGTSNNMILPSDTYWFVIEFFDKTTETGSLTIIR